MDKPGIMLVDLSSIFWQHWNVNHENGMQAARSGTLASIKRASAEWPGLVAICCDSGKSFRKELSPVYKANREKQPEAAYGELNKTKERLAADGLLLWQADGFEADDVIATACKRARDIGHEVRIVSSDKDLMQLLGPGVDVLRSHTWEVWDSRKVVEKLGIDSSQLGDFLALKGDASDNIPGCSKVGDKTAAQLLTTYETIDRLYEALDAGKEVAGKAVQESLKANRADVELSRKLVALRFDAPINFEELFQTREPKALVDPEADEFEAVPVEVEPEKSPPVTAVVPYVEFTRQLEPRSFKELVIACKILFNARTYEKYSSYETMVGAALRGREMGYGVGASLDAFHCMDIKGVRSLALHAHVIIDRCMKDPDCEYFECTETTPERATYEVKRKSRNKAFVLTYTIEQARKANLIRSGGNWEMRPAEQLRKTCGVQAGRVVFPGAAMGLYCIAEMGGDE